MIDLSKAFVLRHLYGIFRYFPVTRIMSLV